MKQLGIRQGGIILMFGLISEDPGSLSHPLGESYR